MVLLSDDNLSALLNAVPSFQEPWKRSDEQEAKYEREFPDDARTPEERAGAFLQQLAYHLGRHIARGDTQEVMWLGAALETLLGQLSDHDAFEFTVAFLESVVYGTEYAGGDPSVITPLFTGRNIRWRWHQAYNYTKGVYLYDQASAEHAASE